MKLLVLGGTQFLGRHLVEAALTRGHTVTLFNRGRTNPDLFPEVEKRRGDRMGDLNGLQNGAWDAVVDTSGFLPAAVRNSVELLSDAVEYYAFISTVSVYGELRRSGVDEQAATPALMDESLEEVTGETYGPLRAACERIVQEAFGGHALILRPGLIVGPHDPTDRFTYWPRRLARGGEVLAPGNPSRQVQLIDVRDLAIWILDLIEGGTQGVFNATGPKEAITMKAALRACLRGVDGEAEFTWVDESFLLDTGVRPFSEMPLWLPEEHNAMLEVSVEKAFAHGLEARPLEETARDTWAWDQERPPIIDRSAGLNPARELALLEAWRAQNEA